MSRRFHSVTTQLVTQSQDAALSGVQVFNNPLIRFKSETFIVMMMISWTYLLHAFYRSKRIEYRYHTMHGARRSFDRSPDGGFKYWDLSKCLAVNDCPLDNETTKNIQFLVGLRNEITHHMSPVLDQFVSARYQACCLNYNRYVKHLFGDRYGIDQHLGYSLQFQKVSREQMSTPAESDLPANVRSYIAKFDGTLSSDELNSDRFAFRMLFVPKLVQKPGQADEVIEFLKPDSDAAAAVNREYMAFKEVERPKFRPGRIVRLMKDEGYTKFTMQSHTDLWKSLDAKATHKGWGVMVEGSWFWYSTWTEIVRQHCVDNAQLFR